jgi:hypothetical protein
LSNNTQQSRQIHGSKFEVKAGPRSTGLLDLTYANRRLPAAPVMMMMVPMVMMMTMPTMVAMPPSHRGRRRLDILLHGRSSTGIAERQRVRPLRRRGENEHCADGGKPQNFRHLHM